MTCKSPLARLFPTIAFLCMLCCIPSLARADTIYTYQGNAFTAFYGTSKCPLQCGMSGSFTVTKPLASNMIGGGGQFQFNVIPLAYRFTDGASIATKANSCFDFFSIGTDSAGSIGSFTIRLFTPTTLAPCGKSPGNFSGNQFLMSNPIDISIGAPSAVNFAAIPQSPGKWSSLSAVPEPATWLLVGGGELLLITIARKNLLSQFIAGIFAIHNKAGNFAVPIRKSRLK